MLKIYKQDHGVYGVIIVVAKSEEDARKLMRYEYNYSDREPVEEHEIVEGLSIVNNGDS